MVLQRALLGVGGLAYIDTGMQNERGGRIVT